MCLGLAATFAGSATLFGVGHLVGKTLVGGLAALEGMWREQLLVAGSAVERSARR